MASPNTSGLHFAKGLFDNKIVVVTGSSGGIGKAIALKFYELGAKVFIHGRSKETVNAAIDSIVKSTGNQGESNRAFPLIGDLGSAAETEAMIKTIDQVGSPDVIIHNVSFYKSQPFESITDDDWTKMFNTNVLSTIRLSRYYLPKMLERNDGGSMLFVSSEAALAVKPFMIHYSMTKAAQLTISRGLAELTKGTTVRVNSILPGPTFTEGVQTYIEGLAKDMKKDPEELKKDYVKDVEPTSLLQRFITPEEVANVAIFLSSPELASAVNGVEYRVEGGIIRHVG